MKARVGSRPWASAGFHSFSPGRWHAWTSQVLTDLQSAKRRRSGRVSGDEAAQSAQTEVRTLISLTAPNDLKAGCTTVRVRASRTGKAGEEAESYWQSPKAGRDGKPLLTVSRQPGVSRVGCSVQAAAQVAPLGSQRGATCQRVGALLADTSNRKQAACQSRHLKVGQQEREQALVLCRLHRSRRWLWTA